MDAKSAEIAKRAGLGVAGKFDTDLYGGEDDNAKYATSLPMNTEESEMEGERALKAATSGRSRTSYGPSKSAYEDAKGPEVDPFAETRAQRISDREDEYHARRMDRVISPVRADPFAEGASESGSRTYAEIMREQQLDQEKAALTKQLEDQKKQEMDEKVKAAKRKAESASASASSSSGKPSDEEQPLKKRGR